MATQKPFRFGISPISLIVVTIFIDLTGVGIIIPLLPFYVSTFQVGPAALGILLTSFSIMQFIFSPILGWISDRTGRRPVLLLSILTSLVSFILFAIANSFFLLLLSRIIAGMATEAAVAQAYIADITNRKERASKMGQVGAAVGAGFIIGPALGGFLSIYGFSVPGFGAAVLALFNLFFVFFLLPESINKKRNARALPNSKENYIRKIFRIMRMPLLGSILIVYFIITFAFSAIQVLVPLLSISFFNFGLVDMSSIFIYIGIVQIILQGAVIGKLENKVGDEKLIVFGPLIMMLGIIVMPLVRQIVFFLASITLVALGSGVMQTVVPSFISKRTAKNEQGSLLGITQSVSSIARVPGPLISGLVVELTGLASSFFLSGFFLMIAFIFGCRVFQACMLRTKKSN